MDDQQKKARKNKNFKTENHYKEIGFASILRAIRLNLFRSISEFSSDDSVKGFGISADGL